jgi:hypothetical protein
MEAILRFLSEDRRPFRRLPLWGHIVPMPLALPMDLPISRPDGFAGFLGIAPQETLSGSMRDRKSRAHAIQNGKSWVMCKIFRGGVLRM